MRNFLQNVEFEPNVSALWLTSELIKIKSITEECSKPNDMGGEHYIVFPYSPPILLSIEQFTQGNRCFVSVLELLLSCE